MESGELANVETKTQINIAVNYPATLTYALIRKAVKTQGGRQKGIWRRRGGVTKTRARGGAELQNASRPELFPWVCREHPLTRAGG